MLDINEKKEKIEDTLVNNQDTVVAVGSLIGGVVAAVGMYYAYYRIIKAGVRDGILASKR